MLKSSLLDVFDKRNTFSVSFSQFKKYIKRTNSACYFKNILLVCQSSGKLVNNKIENVHLHNCQFTFFLFSLFLYIFFCSSYCFVVFFSTPHCRYILLVSSPYIYIKSFVVCADKFFLFVFASSSCIFVFLFTFLTIVMLSFSFHSK